MFDQKGGYRNHLAVENDKPSLAANIKQARLATGLSQAGLARRAGVSQQLISKLERGEAESSTQLWEISQALGVEISELISAEPQNLHLVAETLTTDDIQATKVPLIDSVQAGRWNEIVDPYQPGDSSGLVEVQTRVSPSAFALSVVGDSMVNPNGWPTFPEGTVVVCDPALAGAVKNRDFIVARLESKTQATFKQWVVDGDDTFLRALNPQYPAITISEPVSVVGVVVCVAERRLI